MKATSTTVPEVSDAQVDAMQAIFNLCEAMESGALSISKLEQIMRLSIADGHEQMRICLSMASIALEEAMK